MNPVLRLVNRPAINHASQGLVNDEVGVKPSWDAATRRLVFRGFVVKQFRQPADNQELVLAAFQEEGWPKIIFDPLPPSLDMDPHERLRATIRSLNHCQETPLLLFRANGTGKCVLWEPMPPAK